MKTIKYILFEIFMIAFPVVMLRVPIWAELLVIVAFTMLSSILFTVAFPLLWIAAVIRTAMAPLDVFSYLLFVLAAVAAYMYIDDLRAK